MAYTSHIHTWKTAAAVSYAVSPHLFLINGSAPCLMRYNTIGRCPFDEAFTVEVHLIRKCQEESCTAHLGVSIRLCYGHQSHERHLPLLLDFRPRRGTGQYQGSPMRYRTIFKWP